MSRTYPPTIGVILAGGLARRMGGIDKPLLTIGGHTLLSHVAERLAPQCDRLIISANGNPARLKTDLPVVPDPIPNHPGPLAGILAALEWVSAHQPSIEWVVSNPGDTPFLPMDLVSRLHEARMTAQLPLACASSGSSIHHAVGLWPVHLQQDLRDALKIKGLRSVREWANLHGAAQVSWTHKHVDPFFNINTPGDLAAAEAVFKLHLVAL